MHLCLILSHDESWGPSFNRRAEQLRNFILTSQRGPEELPCAGTGHSLLLSAHWADTGSQAPWAVFTTSDSCSWPKQCCVLPPHVSASFTPSSLPASAGSTSRATAAKTAAPCTCSCCWSCAWEPVGNSSSSRFAWLWAETSPELEKYVKSCSVTYSLHSRDTQSWLEPSLGSFQQISQNISLAPA